MHALTNHVRSRRASGSSNRPSIDDGNGPEDETMVMEPEQGNVLSHIISQLRPGADLSRVALPTFILEPRSMLERITNAMAHPEILLPIPDIEDPVQRFVAVVKFYLSGWHIKPPGVKKPLNPILGETFTCYWEFPDNTRAYYIAEQTSHHPPKSTYFYMAPEHHIRVDGTLKPRSKFLGNSAASMMEGIAFLRLLNRGSGPKGERYILTQPNMYARGILFGKMKYELGDHSFVRCPELGLSADIEFKTKGYFGGTYNAIGGSIKNESGEILYELSGMWSGDMWITEKVTGQKDLIFSALKSKPTPPTARPLEEQEARESQKLWHNTTEAIKARNHDLATDEKSKIEDMQREEGAKREKEGVEWKPRLFRTVRGGRGGSEEGEEDLEWILNANIDGNTPEKQIEQILAVTPILPGQKSNEKHVIPMFQPQQQLQRQQQPKQAPADLVDFGQNESSETAKEMKPEVKPEVKSEVKQEVKPDMPQQPSDLQAAQTQNGGQSQKDMEQMLSSTSTTHAVQGQGPLLDFHQDMHSSLQDASADRPNASADEFVDAKE